MKLPIKFREKAYSEMFLSWGYYRDAPEKFNKMMSDMPPHTGTDRSYSEERLFTRIRWGKRGGCSINIKFEWDGHLHFYSYGFCAMKGNEEYALAKVAEWVTQVLSVLTKYGLIEED